MEKRQKPSLKNEHEDSSKTRYIAKTLQRFYTKVLIVLLGAASLDGIAQTDPSRPVDNYKTIRLNSYWTEHAAAQSDYDTELKRKNIEFEEAFALRQALSNGHYNISYIFPQSLSSQVTNLITETNGSIESLHIDLKNQIVAGNLPGTDGATHIARGYDTQDDAGNAEGEPIDNKGYLALDMLNPRWSSTFTHEIAHTRSHALTGRISESDNHGNAINQTGDFDVFDENYNYISTIDGYATVGSIRTFNRHFLITTNAEDNIHHPDRGGNGTLSYVNSHVSGTPGTYIFEMPIENIDCNCTYSQFHPTADPAYVDGTSDGNVSNRFNRAIESSGTGLYDYTLSNVPTTKEAETAIPNVEIIDGKYKGTNPEAFANLGFDFDGTGDHTLPATLWFYVYDTDDTSNGSNLNFARFTFKDLFIDGIPTETIAALNTDGGAVAFRNYSHGPNSLGDVGNPVTLGLNDQEIAGFAMYPNPLKVSEGQGLTITGNDPLQKISIHSILGQLIKEVNPQGARNFTLNMPEVSTGLYLIRISTEKSSTSQKLIIE